MTPRTISFLPVVLELSPAMFNNSVLAVPGGSARQAGRVRQLTRTLTHSASQSGGGGGCVASCCLFLKQEGHNLCCFYLQLCPDSISLFFFFFYFLHIMSQCFPQFGI